MDKKYIILILIVLLIIFLVYKAFALNRKYKAEVHDAFTQNGSINAEILTENDIKDLPEPVKKYIRYTGAIDKEKVNNFKVVGEGEFKTGQDKDWVKAKSEQYNFTNNPERIYFMKLNMFGLPVIGLHVYKDEKATMLIKVAGLVTVGDAKGEIMNKAETVTVFNDMCILAPASLIDKRIKWETIDPLKVKATFNNNGVKISAELYFNEKGELINFVSNDRYMTTSGNVYQNAPWSTPVSEYKEYNGVKIASYGEAHWSLPEGDFCYGKIVLKEVQYNLLNY